MTCPLNGWINENAVNRNRSLKLWSVVLSLLQNSNDNTKLTSTKAIKVLTSKISFKISRKKIVIVEARKLEQIGSWSYDHSDVFENNLIATGYWRNIKNVQVLCIKVA